LVVGILAVPLLASLYLLLGFFPVATSAPPFPLEKVLAGTALRASIRRDGSLQPPIPASEENLLGGAKTYREICAVCHGVSGAPETPTAKGMYPPPPQLFRGKGVTDDPPAETYWKVANGIRLTGMPGYRGSLGDTAVWQVSLFLANANQLPPSVKAYLATPPPAR
jgi:mono/diheme cytochrome c family protein